MKNTLADLNNHLFEQLERLNDEGLSGEQLETELRRSDGVAKIAEKIIQNGDLQFRTIKHMDEYGYKRQKTIPDMLEIRESRSLEHGKKMG